MHAIDRPHIPRLGLMALGAILLAIIVLLLAASRVGEIGANATPNATAAPVSHTATVHNWRPAGPSWLANPFVSPFRVALPWARTITR